MITIYSRTGEAHGKGCDPWKWVSKLTRQEREAVRNGHLVIISKGVSTYAGNPPFRKVVYQNGRYIPRVPTGDELRQLAP